MKFTIFFLVFYQFVLASSKPFLMNLPIVYTLSEGTQTMVPFSPNLVCNATGMYKVNFISVNPTTNCQKCFFVSADGVGNEQQNFQLNFIPSATRLDFNAENVYTITVACEDSLQETSEANVEVRITPNSKPTFTTQTPESTRFVTSSLSAGMTIFQVSATDTESDTLEYSLETVPTSANFDIRANGEIFTVNGFQGVCTGQNTYDFRVRVKDAYNEFTDPIIVTLNLDFPALPSIGNANQEVFVPENTVQNIHVFSGVTGTISIDSVQPSIMRDKVTLFGGNILRVNEQFNYEEFRTAKVNLLVKSGECEAKFFLTVRVQDQNDVPILTPTTASAAVPEGQITFDPGFDVVDEDFTDTKTFTIERAISGNRDLTGDFTINKNGVITSNFNFDLDGRGSETEIITFTIRVTDSKGGIDESEVTLRVENINDNAPVITTAETIIDTLMDCSPPQRIATVAATDADTGQNGQFIFTGSGAGNLRVTPEGSVFLDTPLTADTTYTYTIQAEDLGNPKLTSAKPVVITVIGQPCTTVAAPVTVPVTTIIAPSGAGAGASAGAAAGAGASATAAAASSSLLDDPINLIWIILLGLLGLLLLGLLAWLLWKFCFPKCCPSCYSVDNKALGRNVDTQRGCCDRCCGKSNPTVGPSEPEYYPEGQTKDFWQEHYQEMDYGDSTHRAKPPTTGLHEDGYLNPR